VSRRATVTGPQRIERERRIADILALRVAGNSLQAIGDAQDPPVTAQAVHKTLKRAIERMCSEAVEEARRIESLRLDELTLGVYPAASAGDIAAIDRCLAIMRRRARLLGLDTLRAADRAVSDDNYTGPDRPRVQIEILGQRERAGRIAVLEAALEGRDLPRTTSLN
jgi:phosphate uptake regulator